MLKVVTRTSHARPSESVPQKDFLKKEKSNFVKKQQTTITRKTITCVTCYKQRC